MRNFANCCLYEPQSAVSASTQLSSENQQDLKDLEALETEMKSVAEEVLLAGGVCFCLCWLVH